MIRMNFLPHTATLFVMLVFASSFGQEMPTAETHLSRPRAFARHAVQNGSVSEQPLTPNGPHWSSNFRFTPDTALSNASANYDSATSTLIVFGGLDWGLEETATNAVLLNSPANGNGSWTTLIPYGAPGSPPARFAHSAVHDSANNRMVAFAGFSSGGDFNDVWVLSDANGQGGSATWTQLAPAGSTPAARGGHTAVYDTSNNRMIIFGGATGEGTGFDDVWVLNNANGLGGAPAWTQLSPVGTPPTGVWYSSAVYDPVNNIMTVFGGYSSTAATNGVWTLSHANGLGGTPQWSNIVVNGAKGSPAKRGAHTSVYDATNNRMIIFGGGNFSGAAGYNDVWVLTNANGLGGTPAWTKLNTSGLKPGSRFDHTAAYDAANNLMMIFAGDNADATFYVVWVLSHANGL